MLGADLVDDPAVYDNALTVEALSTLSTGAISLGPPGPRTVAFGTESNGITLNNGILNMHTTDDYQLDVTGYITGTGGIRATKGTIALKGGGGFGSLSVTGAALTMAAELDLVDVTVSDGTLDMRADASAATLTLSGGGTLYANGNRFSVTGYPVMTAFAYAQ